MAVEEQRIYAIEWTLENYCIAEENDRWHVRTSVRDDEDLANPERHAELQRFVAESYREGRLAVRIVGPVDDRAPEIVRTAAEREGRRISDDHDEMVLIYGPAWGYLVPSTD